MNLASFYDLTLLIKKAKGLILPTLGISSPQLSSEEYFLYFLKALLFNLV